MNEKTSEAEITHDEDHEVDVYGDPGIISYNAKIPTFLVWTYILLPIWGIISLYFFWNGSIGWFDRGYWKELQIAANTTFPIENQNMIQKPDPALENNTSVPQLK